MPQPMPDPMPDPLPGQLPAGPNPWGLDSGFGKRGGGGTGQSEALPLDQYVASIVGEYSALPIADTLLGESLLHDDLMEGQPDLSREFLLSQVANIFWSALFDLSKSQPFDSTAEPLSLPFIVRCGREENSRFDLVAFGTRTQKPYVRTFGAFILQRIPQFSKCLERIATDRSVADWTQTGIVSDQEAYLRFALGRLKESSERFEELVVDYVKTQQPCEIVLPTPIIEAHGSVPDPALSVWCGSPAQASTAGVVVNNANGQRGVTVAGHAITSGGAIAGSRVLVGGKWGTVVSLDAVSDSAFVEMDDAVSFANRPFTSRLQSVGPGPNQTLTFAGLASPIGTARVIGTPLTLTLNLPGIQRQVFTDLATLPGDSGCACFDPSNNLVGFCFGGSGIGSAATFSIWIWADSVFQAHQLQ